MLGQQIITKTGVKTKLDLAIQRLKAFEPPEGYWVAFSGGKDSQCVYHLCQMAGVKFDAHYSVTSVDPPEVVRFIRQEYPDVEFCFPRYSDGKRITMWNLIPRVMIPPTRKQRYCCEKLKESGGRGRVVVTGVRWAESAKRAALHSVASIAGKPKTTKKMADDLGVDFTVNRAGSLVLNDDNDAERRMVEQCYRTQKTMVNPIVDWTDAEVWEFLNEIAKVPHCELYDQGRKRIGCIGCPMSTKAGEELKAYPKYRRLYLKAFARMLEEREKAGKPNDGKSDWSTPEKVMDWWLQKDCNGGSTCTDVSDAERG
nr:MAG TPA: phosphoadenosine-phosphosulfate reductase [Caudoviricetes sp.]